MQTVAEYATELFSALNIRNINTHESKGTILRLCYSSQSNCVNVWLNIEVKVLHIISQYFNISSA